jgi:hypothetical protein
MNSTSRLTRNGHARYRELSARFLAIASTMGADLSEADIRKTTECKPHHTRTALASLARQSPKAASPQ